MGQAQSAKATAAVDAVTSSGGPSLKGFVISAPSEKIEFFSPNFYAQCTVAGMLSCGLTHTLITPLDLVKFNMQRPFTCPVDYCYASYRRKDHLTRHLIYHEGKVFRCPIESRNCEFSFADNVKRHVRELHCADSPSVNQEEYACPEAGCGMVFRYPSKLKKHEDSHAKLDSVETICLEPRCMKHFSNDKCLKAMSSPAISILLVRFGGLNS